MWREVGWRRGQREGWRNVIAPGVMIDLLNPKLTVFFFAFLPYGVFAVTFVALSARLAVESC